MYWFSNWAKIIEFIEIWRILGATKFYFYYQSVTREVYEVFKEYEKMGIVEPIKSEVMPIDEETGYNPDKYLFRIGDRVFQNDCLMRAKEKFAPYVDVDEIFLPAANETLLEFLERESVNRKNTGGFYFNHAALVYDTDRMSHLTTPNDEFDWRTLDFDWLRTAQYGRRSANGKSISMPDRVDLISIHSISRMQWPYTVYGVPHSQVVYYHSRANFVRTGTNTTTNETNAYDQKLRSFFNEEVLEMIKSNYTNIMQNVEISMGRMPLISYPRPYCTSGWRIHNNRCSPYEMCRKVMENVTEWVYANPSPYDSVDLLVL